MVRRKITTSTPYYKGQCFRWMAHGCKFWTVKEVVSPGVYIVESDGTSPFGC